MRKDFIFQLKMDIRTNPIAPLEEQVGGYYSTNSLITHLPTSLCKSFMVYNSNHRIVLFIRLTQEQAEWLDMVVTKRKKKADEEAEKRRIQAELDAFERAQDKKYGETDRILFDENDGEERSLEERFIFPFQQRRAHFSRRIAFLEKASHIFSNTPLLPHPWLTHLS